MSSKVISTILNLKDNFSSVINKASNSTKQFQRQVKLVENQAKQMKEGITGAFNSTAMKVAGVLGGIGIAQFAKDSLMLASDLNEVQNVVDTTFGDAASKINDFAKTTSKSFGISELQAKKYSSTLGSMFKSAGFTGEQLNQMSTDLTGLAGDLASFYNLQPDEAFDKIKAAISGESEPMKALGKDISDTATSTFALANGFKKQWKDATQGEKELWRYKLIMQQCKDAQGDYAKTSQGFANQLKTMKLNFQTLGAKIMGTTIPAFEHFFNKVNDFLSNIDINAIVKDIQNAFDAAQPYFDQFQNFVVWAFEEVKTRAGNAIQEVRAILQRFADKIQENQAAIEFFKNALIGAWEAIKIGAADIWQGVKDILNGFVDFFGGIIEIIDGLCTGNWQKVWDGIKDVAKGAIEIIKGLWHELKALIETPLTAVINIFKKNNPGEIGSGDSSDPGSSITTPEQATTNAFQNAMSGSYIRPYGQNATGTQYWKGGLTMVGEHGPELVNLPGSSKVSTASQTNKMLNSGGHIFNFYFNGNVGTEEFFDQAGEHIINKINLALANM